MKLLYIISMGHSGSTLLDCILGTHPQFLSTGEMRYLGWQLWRSRGKEASVKGQDICTCEKNFRECDFWSTVIDQIHDKTDIDMSKDPRGFDINFFNQFAYQDRGMFQDRVKGYLVRRYLENGWPASFVHYLEPKINQQLANNWLLYETMAHVGNKPFVVDSSKHLTRGLLLQQSRPGSVWFIFIHRSVNSLVSSSKRWQHQTPINDVVRKKKTFEKRVFLYRQKVPDLNFIDVDYADFVMSPATFLDKIVEQLGANTQFDKQKDDEFYIDPTKLHLVAGNPMRYKGKQLVKSDDRWKKELSAEERQKIDNLLTRNTFY